MKRHFLGAVGTVTGSKYLMQTNSKTIIVWMSGLKAKPEHVFIVHGEAKSAEALRVKIKDIYGWESEIPFLNKIIEIN